MQATKCMPWSDGSTGQAKQRFCEALMAKYGKPGTERPRGTDAITVYAIAVERMTGKETALPTLSEQWPANDRTKTPNASMRTSGLKLRDGTGPANS
jgi:uncharacterized protein